LKGERGKGKGESESVLAEAKSKRRNDSSRVEALSAGTSGLKVKREFQIKLRMKKRILFLGFLLIVFGLLGINHFQLLTDYPFILLTLYF
jgi:hypothetical protein